MQSTRRVVRAYRLSRLALHLVWGVAEVGLTFRWRSQASRAASIQRWSRRLVNVLGVKVKVSGTVPETLPANTVLVANHVSWLDIFVMNSVTVSRFVAKAEVRRWPVIGWLCDRTGTLFVVREKRTDTHRVNQQIAEALRNGDCIAIFPEGGTTDGLDVKPFNASLLQPAVEAQAQVAPVALRYFDASGSRTLAAAYINDMSLVESIRSMLRHKQLVVELHFPEGVSASGLSRRELAKQTEERIRPVVRSEGAIPSLLLADKTGPEKPDDPPVESQ
ncbi:lysophospholipid acyltransferase family protein [Parachitinimonas caeni]|uniref:Lysophospholipid acyltransferase family protein n=1 Tax=Parachitinimonas caeni TaxID=3031301 RepID=A0ABT7DVD1_9NEIS|nr:lysophospholipid acyltransferase family protein [Parachitinimonas caeni]MDK2124025.1 lysophospholipid acyltransferase family protein [Parachitinimonas caeni]